MCGILACFNCKYQISRENVVEMARTMQHRGPDSSGIWSDPEKGHYICHQRLAIVDPSSGAQPFYFYEKNEKGEEKEKVRYVLSVNGEIFNSDELRARYPLYPYQTKSDCEVIIPLFMDLGPACVSELQGQFAFVLFDNHEQKVFVARDPLGIVPLYIGQDSPNLCYFSSELKALVGVASRGVEENDLETIHPYTFTPGHYYYGAVSGFDYNRRAQEHDLVRYYKPDWVTRFLAHESLSFSKKDPKEQKEQKDQKEKEEKNQKEEKESRKGYEKMIRDSFIKAVKDQLMADVEFGCLLSGGLDSSLTASIACAHLKATKNPKKLKTFSVGLAGSPDLEAARKVAEYLDTEHHELRFTVQEGLDAIPQVIYHLETYDLTTVRASVPMFLLSRYIKSLGVKMVLSGEGSDEVFGGYAYFRMCPSEEEMRMETARKLLDLHYYDCLRANKSTSAWGVEVRPPFLDQNFLRVAMDLVPPRLKLFSSYTIKNDEGIEKGILRKAFDGVCDVLQKPYLPSDILWRSKAQFSDGVGNLWIDTLKTQWKHLDLGRFQKKYSIQPPTCTESLRYRQLFDDQLVRFSCAKYWIEETVKFVPSIACSSAKALEWCEQFKNFADPSGHSVARALALSASPLGPVDTFFKQQHQQQQKQEKFSSLYETTYQADYK